MRLFPDFGKTDWKVEFNCLKRQKIGREKLLELPDQLGQVMSADYL